MKEFPAIRNNLAIMIGGISQRLIQMPKSWLMAGSMITFWTENLKDWWMGILLLEKRLFFLETLLVRL